MNKDFIKEKIIKKTEAGKSFRNFIKIVVSAILFGVVAAGVFVLSEPTANKLLNVTEATTVEVVTIPRDIPETATTLSPVSQSEALADEESLADGEIVNDVTEPVEEMVQNAIEGYNYSMDDLNNLWNNVAKLCNTLDYSIVRVGSEGIYSGVVVAETFGEVMILTKDTAIENAGSIDIEWYNGEIQSSYLRKADPITGTAIVAISKSEMSEVLKETAVPIALGNSYTIARGDMLIALGSPRGVVHSTAYTWASYIEKNAEAIDRSARLIFTNDPCDSDKGTWIFDASGDLIGMAQDKEGATVVLGISDYKSVLENMINAANSPYLGIVPLDVPEDDFDFAMAPQGIYVKEVVLDSPAYNTGILPGDIITEIKNKLIHSVKDYESAVEELRTNEEISVIVYRRARGEYKEIEYTLTVGAR